MGSSTHIQWNFGFDEHVYVTFNLESFHFCEINTIVVMAVSVSLSEKINMNYHSIIKHIFIENVVIFGGSGVRNKPLVIGMVIL